MTDSEVAVAFQLEAFAKAEARRLAGEIGKIGDRVVDPVRIFVCELAFRGYVHFSAKFHVGDSGALRRLLDECWERIAQGEQLPSKEQVRSVLQDAEIDQEDWDDLGVIDVGAALCIFEESLANAGNNKVMALTSGLERALLHAVKQMMDRSAEAGEPLMDLLYTLESGAKSFPLSEAVVDICRIAQRLGNDQGGLIEWIRHTLENEDG